MRHLARLLREPSGPDETGWKARHRAALFHGLTASPAGPGGAVALLVCAWARYADAHRDRYGSGIGEDYVLGPEWARIGGALLALLNGELGDMDAGALDRAIRESLAAEGREPDA